MHTKLFIVRAFSSLFLASNFYVSFLLILFFIKLNKNQSYRRWQEENSFFLLSKDTFFLNQTYSLSKIFIKSLRNWYFLKIIDTRPRILGSRLRMCPRILYGEHNKQIVMQKSSMGGAATKVQDQSEFWRCVHRRFLRPRLQRNRWQTGVFLLQRFPIGGW